ncbi:MAG: flagellar hook-length control protein FliK, partial [Luteimonas sp.]
RSESDFDRLLEPHAATSTLPNAPAQSAAAPHDHATNAKDTTTATQAASLAEQLLGLLGALPGAPPSGAAPVQMPASTAAPATPPPPTGAKPHVGGATLAAPTIASSSPTSPVTTPAAKPDGGAFASLLPVASTDGAQDSPAPSATDTTPIAGRDAPVPALAAAPSGVDKLPAVPQPALVQPSDPRSGYGDELGSGVVWMAETRLGHAQLQVSPDHLGPIEVRLQIDGARVHAEFYSAQPEVRHALESSLPRLREMLGQQGLQLGQADVGHRQRDNTPRTPMTGSGQSDCFPDDAPLPAAMRRARGLVDEYA